MAEIEALKTMLREVVCPLLAAEGATLYIVSADDGAIHLHLGGTLSGSPAKDVVTSHIVEPAIKSVAPKAKLVVSSGYTLPEGAELLESA
jgi:Fe-S cluster biogenesis protein NfuA